MGVDGAYGGEDMMKAAWQAREFADTSYGAVLIALLILGAAFGISFLLHKLT